MKKFIVSAITLAMGLSLLSNAIIAGEQNQGKHKGGGSAVVGKVEVVKDGDAIKEVKIVGKKEAVLVVLDEKANELVAMEGRYVVVKGLKNDDGHLVVSAFKEKPLKCEGEKKKKKKEQK